MKTITVTHQLNCDICQKKDVEIVSDVPYIDGHWAYVCPDCLGTPTPNQDYMGKRLVKQVKDESKKSNEILQAIECSSPEEVTYVSIRVVQCPACKTQRDMEPDAQGPYTCEGCGSTVNINFYDIEEQYDRFHEDTEVP